MISNDLSMKNHWCRLRHAYTCIKTQNSNIIYIYIWKNMKSNFIGKTCFLSIFHITNTSQWYKYIIFKNHMRESKIFVNEIICFSTIYLWKTIAVVWESYKICVYTHIKAIYNKYDLILILLTLVFDNKIDGQRSINHHYVI